MWPDERFTSLTGIKHPIVQAPMLGSSTVELAAAVSDAGGLGMLALGSPEPEAVVAEVEKLRKATKKPFGLNLFTDPPPGGAVAVEVALRERLRGWYDSYKAGELPDLPAPPPSRITPALAEVLVGLKPAVVSFHFGLPGREITGPLREAGIVVMSSATNTAEAVALEKAGVDAVIAQGWEAGGHRGAHGPSLPGEGVGTMALVPQVADAVSVPVVAAGGIGDARGIAAATVLGASAVQLGTAFLRCPEAATDKRRRERMATASDSDTLVTDAFSGRSARAVKSPYAATMADLSGRLPPFPAMYALAGPLLEAAPDFAHFLLYGQAAPLARDMPAGKLVAKLAREAQALLR